MKRNRIFPSIAAVIAASTSLIGCSVFHHKSDYYSTAVESRPLEVPPDLDSPANANELVVPAAGHGASSSAPAAAPGAAPPAAERPGVASNQLLVADSVQGTWNKVGPTIERAKIGTISSRDDTAHTFILDFDAVLPKPEAEHHWYSAVFSHLGFGEGDPIKAHLLIRVSEDGAGSKVDVVGSASDKAAAAASLRVIQVMHDGIAGSSFPPASTPAPESAPAVASAAPPAAAASTPAASPPAMASTTPASPASSTPPPISGVGTGTTDLHVADTVPNAWTRVGLALERAQLGTLSGRDENAHTYTLDFTGTVETHTDGEHHWYTRVLHPFGGGESKSAQVTRKLTVRVAQDAGGARVSVEGDGADKETADAARHVAQVLRERLS